MSSEALVPFLGFEKKVIEYALPATVQTHEVANPVDYLLVITQQERNGFIKVRLDSDGTPREANKFTLNENPYQGAHGLCVSTVYPGKVWVTLQFESIILLVDPVAANQTSAPRVIKKFSLRSPLRGPHVAVEDEDHLWVTCKDSGHVAKISFDGKQVQYWTCSRRPILVASTKNLPKNFAYASLDMSSKIFCLEITTGKTSEIEIPVEKGSTPVGLVRGPDGHVWFVLLGGSLGGTGTFGRLVGKEITWFQLAIAKTAGLIHLAFDQNSTNTDMRVWLLSSSIGSAANMDAVYTVQLLKDNPADSQAVRIATEDIITLPTQGCMAHRVLQHKRGSFFVTELGVSALAHITGNATLGPPRDDQGADAYALWGIGAYNDSVRY